MKKVILILLLLTSVFSQTYAPEHYGKQVQILRHLDIDPSSMSDLIFVEVRKDLESKHAGVLVDSVQNFSKITPMTRKILSQEDVPEELLYLAMVESGLKVGSASNAKAAGVWQFMCPTTIRLGLRVDVYVDERFDLVKSTHAATTYIKELKDESGKWHLTLLAYNCGNGKLRKAAKQAGSDDLRVLFDADKKYLSSETRDFICKILTLAFLVSDREFLLQKDPPLMNYALSNDSVKVDIPSSVALRDITKGTGPNLATLKKYNPQFRHSFTPPGKGYYMYISLNKVAFFEKSFKNVKLEKIDTTILMTKTYIVRSEDSLYKIAKMHGINAEDIRELNKVRRNHLGINQKFIIPTKEKKSAKNSYAQVSSR